MRLIIVITGLIFHEEMALFLKFELTYVVKIKLLNGRKAENWTHAKFRIDNTITGLILNQKMAFVLKIRAQKATVRD